MEGKRAEECLESWAKSGLELIPDSWNESQQEGYFRLFGCRWINEAKILRHHDRLISFFALTPPVRAPDAICWLPLGRDCGILRRRFSTSSGNKQVKRFSWIFVCEICFNFLSTRIQVSFSWTFFALISFVLWSPGLSIPSFIAPSSLF